ncbi:MAG: thioester dehydrase [Gammaproteobacteria bacterium]|nr:thioester dehydrase [Gammaproteobacteria bacterium]MDE2345114.1 thioester dehydrase [Gammaproteobacteria bacterium]
MFQPPTVIARRTNQDAYELDFLIAADHTCFAGHFPEHPILPGVVQVGWAVNCAEELHGFAAGLEKLERVKFMRPILPGMHVTLRLSVDAESKKVRYEYRDATTRYASGTLCFRMTP